MCGSERMGGRWSTGERGEGSSLKVEKWEEITQQWLIFCNLKRAKWRKPSKRGRSQECMV